MDVSADFDVNEALKTYLSDPASIQTPEADSTLLDCESDPESLSAAVINEALNPIVDAVAENPEAISSKSSLDSLQFLLKCAPTIPAANQSYVHEPDCLLFKLSRSTSYLPPTSLSKILDLVVSGISAEADVIHHELDSEEQDTTTGYKQLLEIFGFLLQWAIAAVETKAAEKPSSGAPSRGRGGKGAKAKSGSNKETAWDSSSQLQTAMDVMSKVLKLKLAKIFLTTSERDTFISLFTRPVYLILENESRVKNTAIRMHAFKVLCIAVKHHGHGFGAQTSIIQNLSYFEHLSEPMAEFLHILAEQYDHPQLTEEILRELSNKEFNSNDLKGPKSVSTFVAKISELAPRLVIKQMTLLAKLLDGESYTLRCAIIEVCGNLIGMLSKQESEERSETTKGQINAFFDVLEERFLDINPYCRCRAIQVYVKLCELEQKFPKRRQAAAELATRSLEDKSSNVRRNAIKLLGKLVSTHPYGVLHGGQLSHKEWNARLQACQEEIDALEPQTRAPGLGEKTSNETNIDDDLLDDKTHVEQDPSPPMTEEQKAAALEKAAAEAATTEAMNKLQLTRRYYSEALRFIEVVQEASPTVTQLLASRNKSEIIEAMDFFVILDAYKLETARAGIRRMLRLIWTKGNSDEGKGVQTHLIECYKGLFFDAPDQFSPNDAANYVARNMISLTFGASPAELTSLEQLLATMMKQELINEAVVQKLWQVYGVQKKEISAKQRRGAIIVLGMLALADPEIVVRDMETCLKIGLGPLGRADLGLARYTCVALRRINAASRQSKGIEKRTATTRLSNDHAVLIKLAAMTYVESDSKEWFGVAEQAVGAIYALSKHPDTLCTEIIRRKTKRVFQQQIHQSQESSTVADQTGLHTPPPDDEQRPEEQRTSQQSALALAQLLFIVGHVAIKQIVHLELCELDFKRRKAEKEKTAKPAASPSKKPTSSAKQGNEKRKSSNQAEEQDELDLIAGTTEDDFTDAVNSIRERELLYSPNALLSSFGPLVADICANNTQYAHRELQAQAALCMAKLMCVSAEYCEQHLGLLLTVLERSQDATTRGNLVIALGDMAVCFNHLLDENTDFLYRRLSDRDARVKRTCLMTLTFLILAGQVKVKGQLGEMAKCLEDADKKISDLTRMFFTELAGKDNAVYNHFVDMFSLLSADGELEEDGFRKIVKFLAGFVEKDKHAKQLANKLAARLPRCENERQWNDVAYALSLLQHKDEEIQKQVAEGFQIIQATA